MLLYGGDGFCPEGLDEFKFGFIRMDDTYYSSLCFLWIDVVPSVFSSSSAVESSAGLGSGNILYIVISSKQGCDGYLLSFCCFQLIILCCVQYFLLIFTFTFGFVSLIYFIYAALSCSLFCWFMQLTKGYNFRKNCMMVFSFIF